MSLHEQYIAFMTIFRKEVRRFLRIWMQTLLPPVITITLYFIIFGNLIGSRIGQMGGYRCKNITSVKGSADDTAVHLGVGQGETSGPRPQKGRKETVIRSDKGGALRL